MLFAGLLGVSAVSQSTKDYGGRYVGIAEKCYWMWDSGESKCGDKRPELAVFEDLFSIVIENVVFLGSYWYVS
jgi:hypothetical protein